MLGVVGFLVVVWAALAGIQLLGARGDVRDGVDGLEAARDELSPSDLIEGTGIGTLEDAEESFRAARDQVRSPWVSPLRALPVVGRQVRSVDAMSGAAADVVAAGVESIDEAGAELERDPTAVERVGVMRDLAVIADDASAELAAADLGPDEALIGPLARARDEFASELADAEQSLVDVSAVATAMADLFQGPSRYVLIAANNAEMRAGSGMYLQAGPLVAAEGDLEVGELVPTADLRLPPGAVSLDPGSDLAQWSVLAPTEEWRNLAVTPRFDVTAPLAAEMWTAATGETVDGVLAVDPVALRALLTATGPVEVDGLEINEHNVLQYLYHDQYVDVDYDDPAQAARRERLGAIVEAVVDAIDDGAYESSTLVEALIDAAEGRHILAWSNREPEEAGWEAAGIDGTLAPNSLMVSVLNRGANKLDQYLVVDADLDLQPAAGGADATLRVRLVNETPEGEPRYIAGPHPTTGLAEGAYRGILAVNVPGAASGLTLEGMEPVIVQGADGPTRVVAADFEIARGAVAEAVVRFELPPGIPSIEVEPSARVPSVNWSAQGEFWVGEDSRTVGLG